MSEAMSSLWAWLMANPKGDWFLACVIVLCLGLKLGNKHKYFGDVVFLLGFWMLMLLFIPDMLLSVSYGLSMAAIASFVVPLVVFLVTWSEMRNSMRQALDNYKKQRHGGKPNLRLLPSVLNPIAWLKRLRRLAKKAWNLVILMHQEWVLSREKAKEMARLQAAAEFEAREWQKAGKPSETEMAEPHQPLT